MDPRAVSVAIRRLRAGSLALLDGLAEADLEVEALPDWSVLDVFRHLADSDRASVLGFHLLEFLPGKDLLAFERVNDDNLARLRDRDRAGVRRELDVWGRRLATVVGVVPAPLGRVRVPTAFGRVPLAWMGALRLYDEWVHQWDVAEAVGRETPALWPELRDLLAEFQLHGLSAGPARELTGQVEGVVEVRVRDAGVPAWRFDLAAGEHGPEVASPPTAVVTTDVAGFCLLAAARRPWREVPTISVEGADTAAATALLDVVRVV